MTLTETSGDVSEAGDTEDDSRTVSTDDPVGAAMSFALEEQENIEDEDDEQILYPRIPTESHTVSVVSRFHTFTMLIRLFIERKFWPVAHPMRSLHLSLP